MLESTSTRSSAPTCGDAGTAESAVYFFAMPDKRTASVP